MKKVIALAITLTVLFGINTNLNVYAEDVEKEHVDSIESIDSMKQPLPDSMIEEIKEDMDETKDETEETENLIEEAEDKTEEIESVVEETKDKTVKMESVVEETKDMIEEIESVIEETEEETEETKDKIVEIDSITIEAIAKDSAVELNWNDIEESDNYILKRRVSSEIEYTIVADNITKTSYIDTELTNNKTYYYVIIAEKETGNIESEEISVIPNSDFDVMTLMSLNNEPNGNLTSITTEEITLPNSPENINAISENKKITLTWNAVDNADYYIVKRTSISGKFYKIVADSLTKTTYTQSELENGKSYYYVIIAVNEVGESELSNEVEAIPGVQRPDHVIVQVVDDKIQLSWDPVSNADTYSVKRSEEIDGTYTVISRNKVATNYVDDNIEKNKVYYYVITAVNSIGESKGTEPITAIVKEVPKRFILLIVLSNGMQKEYDLDTTTTAEFIKWYINRGNGIGSPLFTLFAKDKELIFENSKDYIGFNSILFYQLNEYTVNMQR